MAVENGVVKNRVCVDKGIFARSIFRKPTKGGFNYAQLEAEDESFVHLFEGVMVLGYTSTAKESITIRFLTQNDFSKAFSRLEA